MDGLALHYYTLPSGSWRGRKGPADGLRRGPTWFATLKHTLRMEELVTEHSAIMDKYDPEKKVALMVDEWGTWYDVEPGRNPGFLYQQNTLRDALVAGAQPEHLPGARRPRDDGEHRADRSTCCRR